MAFIKVIPTPTAALDPQPARGVALMEDGARRGGLRGVAAHAKCDHYARGCATIDCERIMPRANKQKLQIE